MNIVFDKSGIIRYDNLNNENILKKYYRRGNEYYEMEF